MRSMAPSLSMFFVLIVVLFFAIVTTCSWDKSQSVLISAMGVRKTRVQKVRISRCEAIHSSESSSLECNSLILVAQPAGLCPNRSRRALVAHVLPIRITDRLSTSDSAGEGFVL